MRFLFTCFVVLLYYPHVQCYISMFDLVTFIRNPTDITYGELESIALRSDLDPDDTLMHSSFADSYKNVSKKLTEYNLEQECSVKWEALDKLTESAIRFSDRFALVFGWVNAKKPSKPLLRLCLQKDPMDALTVFNEEFTQEYIPVFQCLKNVNFKKSTLQAFQRHVMTAAGILTTASLSCEYLLEHEGPRGDLERGDAYQLWNALLGNLREVGSHYAVNVFPDGLSTFIKHEIDQYEASHGDVESSGSDIEPIGSDMANITLLSESIFEALDEGWGGEYGQNVNKIGVDQFSVIFWRSNCSFFSLHSQFNHSESTSKLFPKQMRQYTHKGINFLVHRFNSSLYWWAEYRFLDDRNDILEVLQIHEKDVESGIVADDQTAKKIVAEINEVNYYPMVAVFVSSSEGSSDCVVGHNVNVLEQEREFTNQLPDYSDGGTEAYKIKVFFGY
ncbi:hypothetical protein QR680_003815 [Steinernema hermaphroditum]|uniref:Uncharacterized protein n=1 Tax=Steinernema hermaphroditum TaxID=289476 RepID=A0AA39HMP6_9BILA|nr:hypothetical protein QR680_003815 [Steinernema hermaphroditum]